MAEASAPGVPSDVRVATPASWYDLDLNPITSARSIARLIEERAGMKREQAPARWQLASVLEKATADARSRGAVFASVFSDVVEDRPVVASLIVSLASDHSVVAGDSEARARGVAELLRCPEEPADGADVRVLELSAGWAVRSRHRATVEAPELKSHPIQVENLQYFAIIPATTNLLLLSFATPNVGLADAMVELFDAMAESLSWRW